MSPEQIEYSEKRIKLIDEELQKCEDEERIKTLMAIKESILKFIDFKTKTNAA